MPTPEQKKKLLKAKIAVALHDELGRVPKKEEIDQVFLLEPVLKVPKYARRCDKFKVPKLATLEA